MGGNPSVNAIGTARFMRRSKTGGTGKRATRFRLLSNGSSSITTGRLFETLASGLRRQGYSVDLELRELPRGVLPKLRAIRQAEARSIRRIYESDVLVVHSPLALSLLSILAARLTGRPVVGFVWDLYPESTRVAGSMQKPLLLRAYWVVERLSYVLASRLLVSSEDYLPRLKFWQSKTRVLPLWPCDPIANALQKFPGDPERLRLAFAGQINSIRSIDTAIDELLEAWSGDCVELHIFSRDQCPESLTARAAENDRLQLVEHGHLDPRDLQARLGRLDVGWVSLDPTFELPAFPSKIMAYLSAGLPVVYTGPPLPGLRSWLKRNQLGVCTSDGQISPGDIADLRGGFAKHRDHYLEQMEAEWFHLDRLL